MAGTPPTDKSPNAQIAKKTEPGHVATNEEERGPGPWIAWWESRPGKPERKAARVQRRAARQKARAERLESAKRASPDQAKTDQTAYRIAVGAVGFALVAFLIGAAWIAAAGDPVPTQYWSTGSGLAGALIGILSPRPTAYSRQSTNKAPNPNPAREVLSAVSDLFKNRSVLILLVLFIASLYAGIHNNSPELVSVAAASGGALLGLLAPPPGQSGS